MKNSTKLFLSFLITFAVLIISGLATANGVKTWYSGLQKPYFNPPNWIFAPVWTILYILMAIALYKIWKLEISKERNRALLFFFLQLSLNFCWSFIFFYFHQISLALVDIVLLWSFILITILFFSMFNRTAAWLLVPYLAWVSFATILNIAILKLNATG
ncbi:MAG: tryptophan-rich sensory protein [Bacteroidetes bacterium]|nr:tryptophan-rich sensory protein [Bacteroidota bacterium]